MSTSVMDHKRRAAVFSLHFSYSHASHIMAYGKLLRELGFAVSFVLDERYIALEEFIAIGGTISCREYCSNPGTQPFDLAVFCNSAVKNHSLARAMRARGTTVLYIFHEPEPIWSFSVLRTEGLKKTVRFVLSTLLSIKTICASSAVIVCSLCGRALYERYYRRFNSNVHVLPLLFDDEIGQELFEQMRSNRRALGFVGTACRAHGFDAFVAFVKYALRNGSDIPFTIATSVDLTSVLRADHELAQLVSEGRIRMQHGQKLSNDQINQYYLQCFCIWNVYRRSTQSGVLPRAFMAGSPVLASRIGSFSEYVRAGVTGEFADSSDGHAVILEVAERMREHSLSYAKECRSMFLGTFYWRSNLNKLAEIIESASTESSSHTKVIK
jgi:glycosyltransferase involved in cell wall biosynthesis